jgi:hypothetical protein
VRHQFLCLYRVRFGSSASTVPVMHDITSDLLALSCTWLHSRGASDH